MSTDPAQSRLGPRLVLAIGAVVAVAFVGVPVAKVVAAHDPRPGSDLWTEGERALVAEVEALAGPVGEALAASERLIGPGLSIPAPPDGGVVDGVFVRVGRQSDWRTAADESARRPSPQWIKLAQLITADTSFEQLDRHFNAHFPHRDVGVGIFRDAVEFTDSTTNSERALRLFKDDGQVQIVYVWNFFVDDRMDREALYAKFGRWVEPPEWESWVFEELVLEYDSHGAGDLLVEATIEPESFSPYSWHSGKRTYALARPFPVDKLESPIGMAVMVVLAFGLAWRWDCMIRRESA